ncbi:P-loop containing nucleoside triphosphate hydrolase protein [Mucor mucedo]|uniref:P-loop containing nucleoside triphosphate hydrolase protein n=1 Tax=Mucor mucedo TaxID=29922 RepID=UPI002220B249|nr:P-loop containing nucleoside triphosphate hydrolase protein [Mucor mucedo]KAI7895794.1 P-loop containing nucleoside triphosphate hydrolase protein [Mucor mucedo]
MADPIPAALVLAIIQAVFLASSSIALSVQRVYHIRHHGESVSKSHFKEDTARDIANTPFSNGNRMSRIIFETFVLTLLSGYVLFDQVTKMTDVLYPVIVSIITFIACIHCLVLAITAARFPLPSKTGWSLNLHICVHYAFIFTSSIVNVITILWNDVYISFTYALPFFLLALFGFDLLYTTVTVKNGSPFLDENGKKVNGYNVESIIGRLYFNWITPIVDMVNEKSGTLTDEDLPNLPPTHRAHNMYYIFGESRGKKLLKRIYLGNSFSINMQATLGAILPMIYFSTPFFLNRFLTVIQEITSGEGDSNSYLQGFGYIFGMAIFITISNLLLEQLWFFAQASSQTRIKSMLNMEIYRKTLRRMDVNVMAGEKINKKEHVNKENDEIEGNEASSMTGMIVNLMSTDSSRISDFLTWWFVIIEVPLELFIGIYFLYSLLGWSSILGLAVMVIALPINHLNSKISIRTQAKLMKRRDMRVSLMNEVLQGIRQIKFFAWESNWTERILETRNIELGHLRTVYITEVILNLLWQGVPLIVNTVAFWSFTKLEGKELTAPIAFSSILIFNEIKETFTVIPETVIHLLETLISIDRIEKYLEEDEVSSSDQNTYTFSAEPSSFVPITQIGFKNATIGWPKTHRNAESETATLNEEQNSFILKDLDVVFPNNELSLICGSTGSGKTLLMLSLLGETEIKKGTVSCPRSASSSSLDDTTAINSIKPPEDAPIVPEDWILPYAVAYVSQTAWLQNASIKDNILFGLPYVSNRYKATLTACALDKDLSYLEDGDTTEIGEKGITLSGGQKARVALARAVYSRAQNVMMDDVLSAVDAHTAKHLFKKCLQSPLMSGRTQILITHHVNLCIQGAAHVVFVKDGRIKLSGSPAGLKKNNQLSMIFEENVQEGEYEEQEDGSPVIAETKKTNDKPKILVQDEDRASGTVKMRLYKLYFGLVGSWFFWTVVFTAIIGVKGLDILSNWWLKRWTQSYEVVGDNLSSDNLLNVHNVINSVGRWPISTYGQKNLVLAPSIYTQEDASNSLNKYLGFYALINLVSIILSVFRYAYMYWGGIRASKRLYEKLLDRVFHAPLRFFDTTPVGRIVNRFSNDFLTVDANIPMDIMQFLVQVVIIAAIVAVAASVLPALIAIMIFTAAINVYYGLRFVSSSRDLKRLDSVSRSPLFTLFSETIVGVTTIRAFGMSQNFMLEMIRRIDDNTRPMFYAWLVNRWISTRIAITGVIICVVTGVTILFNLDHVDAATAGFCLSYVLMFTNMTYWGVRRYSMLEMSFNAVERIAEFLEIEQEAPSITDVRPPPNWPSEGSIQVNNLHVKYAADLETILKGVAFSVKPREKIGIVGRTGSGKSTLALAFFRFIELYKGSIVIDGVDISDIGTEDLRSNLTIIPQDPVLFSGTLESNMNPFNEFSKDDIFTALRRVHLLDDASEQVNENVFKDLSTPVSEGGQNFSQGQRQLLCLARALLKNQKVVLMDEATASVDFETDKAIQKTIAQEFAESTILCIAHRLNTVIEYDRILVLNHGEIVEFQSPLTLLRDANSAFYKMCRNSGEFENLLALAKAKHELVDTT